MWNDWRTKGIKPYFQPGPLSEILTIVNLQHAATRIWTCIELELRLSWMKLYSSDNHDTTTPLQLQCAEPLFSSDMTTISYLNIIINIIAITNPTLSRVLKIFIAFFSDRKFFVKMFFHYVTAIFIFFDHTINEVVNCIFAEVCLKRLTKLIIYTY